MPTYEYRCEKCGHQFEQFQSMKDPALTVCPKDHCAQKAWGRGRVKRVLGSGAGLIFKGSGFYITDYRSESYKAAAKKESPSGGSSGGEAKSGAAGVDKKPSTPKAESKARPTGGGKE